MEKYSDPEWWDNRRPSSREYKEQELVPGVKVIRMTIFSGTERLGAVRLRADAATLEITLAIEDRKS